MSPANPPTAPRSDVLIERLDALRSDVCEMSGNVRGLSTDFANFRVEYTRAHVEVVNDSKRALERIVILEREVEDIRRVVPAVKVLIWAVGALTVPAVISVMSLIWQLITHQVVMP
jgi:hypothetical protein